MQTVATISAKAGEPGLIAYLCPTCGGGQSDLVYPEYGKIIMASTPTNVEFRIMPSGEGRR
jgi:hypothetical protein